ncbi:endonuclease/exonuclease/phosphatase family protein [Erythrobacter sp. SCSIO 43205]|uniref:endonuclease/exonuclease/phosphatase family protein n=1 Tax=Erythrobacter sp. SCSIO 43205 TaxID=2779361 RepID=UPI001CA8FE35|nr:endonuclease/exonuclease/phosphatase family protein [Erythrobacter sp. SCSIO 43205]UAB79408.1 endonuclease/exonuclease/phosphatase family protein [Erythrobacter sp. SCSIO 43205]
MMTKRSIIALAAGGLALASAILPLFPTDFWAIRATGFVREPASYLFIVLAIVVALFVKRHRLIAEGMFLAAVAINFMTIWPYTALAPTQIDLASDHPQGQCFTAFSANVKMKNTQYDRLIEQIESLQPDIVFLTEVDEGWAEALEPMLSEYPYTLTHPQSNTFGKVFASRLPVVDADILERADENTPSIFAVLQPMPDTKVQFVGLHPKAPLPAQSTGQRDESIKRAADRTMADISGAIAMGDFNDVPWSSTTTDFREMGDWKDPRIGRGTFATFPAFAPALGWPLDQIMVRGEIKVRRFEVLDANGSDHRAVLGEMCLDQAIVRAK